MGPWNQSRSCAGETRRPPLLARCEAPYSTAMAPHLSGGELDTVRRCAAQRMPAPDTLAVIAKDREQQGVAAPKIWAVRRAMAGVTHLQGKPEARGRRKRLTPAQAQRLFDKRRELVRRVKGERYVSYREVRCSARVPEVHDTTTARYLRTFGVVWRRMREKPARTEAHEASRKDVCRLWRKHPAKFWTDTVDLIIDAKKYALPGNDAAARRLHQQKVHATLRTRGEGLDRGHTRPSPKKHKFNAGGYVRILGGICGDRVVLWEEVRGRWCGQRAADMYAGPIKRVLQQHRPGKRSWLAMERQRPLRLQVPQRYPCKGREQAQASVTTSVLAGPEPPRLQSLARHRDEGLGRPPQAREWGRVQGQAPQDSPAHAPGCGQDGSAGDSEASAADLRRGRRGHPAGLSLCR